MTPADYRKLIINETGLDSFRLSDDDFKTFADIARSWGSGKLVIDQWKKFLNTGNDSVSDFIEWCIDVHLSDQ